MRYKFWSFLFVFILTGTFLWMWLFNQSLDKNGLMSKISGRVHHEYLMTHDPKTGQVPTERLHAARRYMNTLASKNNRSITNFEERGPDNVSGRTRSILIDQNDPSGQTIWAGGVSGGLWKSTDLGNNWIPINDQFESIAIGAIAQDPNNPQIIYFGTGESFGVQVGRGVGIYKSTNGGTSFQLLSNTTSNPDFDYISDMVVTQSGAIIVSSSSRFCNRGGVLRSGNGGLSWAKFVDDDHCGDVDGARNHSTDLELTSDGTLYAGFGMLGDNDGIFRSSNDGISWEQVYTSKMDQSRIELASAPSNPSVILALINNEDDGGPPYIIKSIDKGENWTELPTPAWNNSNVCQSTNVNWAGQQGWYNLVAEFDPSDENVILIGAIDLFRSTDGGDSWDQISTWRVNNCHENIHADHHFIKYHSNGTVFLGNDGGVYKSDNINNQNPTYDFISTGYNVTQFYSIDHHPEEGNHYAIGGTQDNGSQAFNSEGINSTIQLSPWDGGFVHIDQNEPNIQLTSFVFNFYWVTTDNWQTQRRITLDRDEGLFINPTDYDDENNLLYASFRSKSFIRWDPSTLSSATDDEVIVANFPDENNISAVCVSPHTSNRLFFGFTNGEVHLLDNAHEGINLTSKKIFSEVEGYISSIAIDPQDEEHIIVTLSNYGVPSVYETKNATADNPLWLSIEGNLPDMPVRWSAIDPTNSDRVILATELGLWTTDNIRANLTSWMPIINGMPNVRCDMVKIRPSDNRVFAATFGRGLFTSDNFVEQLVDADNDGYTSDVDCDDNDPNINPGAQEIINNDVDENCDGIAPIVDNDNDGYHFGIDCNDFDPNIYPGATEVADNGIDEDCDGSDLSTSTFDLEGISLKIYPNPATDYILLETKLQDYSISIYSLGGQLVLSRTSLNGDQRIALNDIPSGYYLIKVLELSGSGRSALDKIYIGQ